MNLSIYMILVLRISSINSRDLQVYPVKELTCLECVGINKQWCGSYASPISDIQCDYDVNDSTCKLLVAKDVENCYDTEYDPFAPEKPYVDPEVIAEIEYEHYIEEKEKLRHNVT
jgi:hypothetical protein